MDVILVLFYTYVISFIDSINICDIHSFICVYLIDPIDITFMEDSLC